MKDKATEIVNLISHNMFDNESIFRRGYCAITIVELSLSFR
jgi:hypothetical protein